MKVAIAGFGKEGMSSLEYFRAQGHEVVILDENQELIVPEGTESFLGENAFRDLSSFDLIIRSAGLHPLKLLEHNPDVSRKITTQLNEFLKVCPSKKIIGVTGTKGKGTTSTLIQKILEQTGASVVLGGNIGVPVLSLLGSITEDTYVVLELSSFQLSDLIEAAPHVAVCLMVDPEHLDWHGDLDSYIAAKANLFSHQSADDIAIFYPYSDLSKQIVGSSQGLKLPYYSPPGAYIEDDALKIEDNVICQTAELKLLGQHNWQNVCAAITAVWQHEKDLGAIKQAVTSFSGLEHRLEFVREVDGINYYNDSFASQPKATEAAVLAIHAPKVLIIGGFDRGLDLNELGNFMKAHENEIRSIILIGASAGRLTEALNSVGLDNFINGSQLNSMNEIVTKARDLAEPGDAVILSPGFASFDMFKDFVERGVQFKNEVNNL